MVKSQYHHCLPCEIHFLSDNLYVKFVKKLQYKIKLPKRVVQSPLKLVLFRLFSYCLFLNNRSLRVETPLGSDGSSLGQNAQARLKILLSDYKHAGQLTNGNDKQIWKQRRNQKNTKATPNKPSWTISIPAFWRRERRICIQSQLHEAHYIFFVFYVLYIFYNPILAAE